MDNLDNLTDDEIKELARQQLMLHEEQAREKELKIVSLNKELKKNE